MNNPDYRIPEHMASEILAEAARLHMEANKGYSIRELQQAGLEAKIPLETIEEAVKIVEERQRIEQLKRQQARDKFKQRIKKITIAITESDVRTGFFNPCRDVACNVSTFINMRQKILQIACS